jgi:hypothetical protein
MEVNMGKNEVKANRFNERRAFLRTGGLGALALVISSLTGSQGEAEDVKYKRSDLDRVNKKLRRSARERKAFYANPQAYLKRHGVNLPKEMIPSRKEIEEALRAKPGTPVGNGKAAAPIITIAVPSGSGKTHLPPDPLGRKR